MKYRILLLVLIGISVCASAMERDANQVLCVEIGGKKIIAAMMPDQVTLENLRTVEVIEFPSKPWFSHLASLFDPSTDSPLRRLMQRPHAKVSVSIFGPLFEQQGLIDVAKRNIPSQIHKLCELESPEPLMMKTDSICWARGCLEFQRLKGRSVDFPFLIVILKTGVGFALVEEGKITAIESYISCNFSRLEELCRAQGQSFERFDIHQALGNGFFNWAENRGDLYQQRFNVFVEEVSQAVQEDFSVSIKTVFVGGENSRLLTGGTVLNALTLDGIAPELIQLLGCMKIAQEEGLQTETYPSYEEIKKKL